MHEQIPPVPGAANLAKAVRNSGGLCPVDRDRHNLAIVKRGSLLAIEKYISGFRSISTRILSPRSSPFGRDLPEEEIDLVSRQGSIFVRFDKDGCLPQM